MAKKREKAIEKERMSTVGSESERRQNTIYMIKLLLQLSDLKQNAGSISANQQGCYKKDFCHFTSYVLKETDPLVTAVNNQLLT